MKFILTFLFTFFVGATIYGQVITYDDLNTIIPYLQKEDFKNAFEKTNQLLSSTQNDSSELRGIVTYMNIFSSAGMVSIEQMSYDEFLNNANKYVGQYIVMAGHPCVDSLKQRFNSLQFITKNAQLQGTTTAANKNGTTILCFEYFEYADPVNPTDYVGKNVRCGGILKSVEPNPNKSLIWISRLYVSNAFARVMQ